MPLEYDYIFADPATLAQYVTFNQKQHVSDYTDKARADGTMGDTVSEIKPLVSCELDEIFKSKQMDNRGYKASACYNHEELYKLDGLEDDLKYSWVELTIERCKGSTCAETKELNKFLKYLQVMPVTRQNSIDIDRKLDDGGPALNQTVQYYGVQQLNYHHVTKFFFFIKEVNYVLYDNLFLPDPSAKGSYFNTGEVHKSNEQYSKDEEGTQDVVYSQ